MAYDFKKLTLKEMADYIEKNAPEDKAWFKSVAFEERTKKQAVKQFDESGKPIIKIGKDGKQRQAVKMEEVKGGKKEMVFNLLKAKYAFCNKYMPEIIPVADNNKTKASDILANW